MPNHPSKPGQRILKPKSSPDKSLGKVSRKTRSEISGTFHFKARRDSIFGMEIDLHESGPRYIREGGKVVNFGGQVTAVGTFGKDEKAELLNLVENVGEKQRLRDSCDRILRVKATTNGFVVHTAKPHLAVSIGKRLHAARKGGELNVVWSHGNQPVRVLWIADVE